MHAAVIREPECTWMTCRKLAILRWLKQLTSDSLSFNLYSFQLWVGPQTSLYIPRLKKSEAELISGQSPGRLVKALLSKLLLILGTGGEISETPGFEPNWSWASQLISLLHLPLSISPLATCQASQFRVLYGGELHESKMYVSNEQEDLSVWDRFNGLGGLSLNFKNSI